MMPQPPPGRPVFDQGNPLLAEQPASLDLARIPTPLGERLALTVRTPSATVSVFLGGKDARTWAKLLTREAEGMSAAGLVTGVVVPAGNGRTP